MNLRDGRYCCHANRLHIDGIVRCFGVDLFCFQRMCTLGEETINTPMYIQMDSGQCHIMTDVSLRRYTLIGEPSMAGKAIKILRLAAFAPAVTSSVDYNVRVYFVEDTGDALEVSARRSCRRLLNFFSSRASCRWRVSWEVACWTPRNRSSSSTERATSA